MTSVPIPKENLRGWLAKIGLALGSALATLVAVGLAYEIYARVQDARWRHGYLERTNTAILTKESPNEILVWDYHPYSYLAGRDLLTNRWGFRERDFTTPDKPDGVFRVAFVGDSLTLGLKARAHEAFPYRFETQANARPGAPPVQGLNFGIDGYHALQVAELTRARVLAWAPDSVVLTLCLNDFDFDDSSGEKHRFFRRPRSFLLARVRQLHKQFSNLDFHDYHFRRNHEAVFGALVALSDELRSQDIDFRVTVVPAFYKAKRGFAAYPIRHLHTQIVERLARHGIPVLDLLPVFEASGQLPRALGFDIWHPRPAGHRLMAEALVGFVPVPEPTSDAGLVRTPPIGAR